MRHMQTPHLLHDAYECGRDCPGATTESILQQQAGYIHNMESFVSISIHGAAMAHMSQALSEAEGL